MNPFGPRPTPEPEVDHLIDIPTLAEAWGTTERHIRRLVFEKRIPYRKVGAKVRFSVGELNVYLDEHAYGPYDDGA